MSQAILTTSALDRRSPNNPIFTEHVVFHLVLINSQLISGRKILEVGSTSKNFKLEERFKIKTNVKIFSMFYNI